MTIPVSLYFYYPLTIMNLQALQEKAKEYFHGQVADEAAVVQ